MAATWCFAANAAARARLDAAAAHLPPVDHNTGGQRYFGNLGVDLMSQAGSVRMDIGGITLALQ
jgi:hypothetical protein